MRDDIKRLINKGARAQGSHQLREEERTQLLHEILMPKKKSQSDKFKELAKKLGCDESEEAFKEKLKKIIRPDKKDRP